MAEPPAKSQFLIYRSEDGRIKLDVRFEGETAWLTQALMADLFDSTKQNIGLHLKHIFEEGELEESSVVKYYLTTAADSKNYRTAFYNLDAIISVSYRVNSRIATQFASKSDDFEKTVMQIRPAPVCRTKKTSKHHE